MYMREPVVPVRLYSFSDLDMLISFRLGKAPAATTTRAIAAKAKPNVIMYAEPHKEHMSNG